MLHILPPKTTTNKQTEDRNGVIMLHILPPKTTTNKQTEDRNGVIMLHILPPKTTTTNKQTKNTLVFEVWSIQEGSFFPPKSTLRSLFPSSCSS